MLTREAFNALLKTLEEPPAHVIFIFATTELHKIPATILSRCQCHDFHMIPLKQLTEQLRLIAERENINISPAALSWIAVAGNGSMRDAQSIFDQTISYAGTDISDADVEALLNLADKRYVAMLSEAILEKNAGKCLKILEEGYYAGFDMKYFYQLLLNHFRNLLFIKVAGKETSLFNLANDELEKLKALVKDVSREAIQRLLDILMSEEEVMRRTGNPRLHLEVVVVRMAYLEEIVPVDKILDRVEDLQKRLKSGARETGKSLAVSGGPSSQTTVYQESSGAVPETREEPAPYTGSSEDGEQLWEDFKAFVKKQSAPLWSKIEPGRLAGYENKTLRLGFLKDYIFLDDIREKTVKERLTEMAKTFFQDNVKVKIEIIKSEADEPSAKTKPAAKNNHDIKQEALNHPLLQKVLDIFEGAEVREIIPKRNNV